MKCLTFFLFATVTLYADDAASRHAKYDQVTYGKDVYGKVQNASRSLYSHSSLSKETNPSQEERVVSLNNTVAQNEPDMPRSFQAPDITQGNVQVPFESFGEEQPFKEPEQGPVINFNNVSITEYLRFVSRLTGKNFVFDPQELQFPVTIISETPATLENVMAALQQNLRIHDFYMIEEGNSFVIHSNTAVKAPGGVFFRNEEGRPRPDIATEVFLIKNVLPVNLAGIIQAMTTAEAVVSVIEESSSIIVTDILPNIQKIRSILKKVDVPNIGLDIGQYVALNNSPAALVSVASRILTPIALDKTLIFVPYQTSNSVFVVSTPFLVEKALSVMQALDMNIGTSGLLNVDDLKFDSETAKKLRLEKEQLTKERRETPIPLTQDEVEILTEREKFAILKAKGFTPEDITRLSAREIDKILREKGLSAVERETILGQTKDIFQSELPLGQVESTQFLIHKLQYRGADGITKALRAISESLQTTATATGQTEQTQSDLVVTLNSVQMIEETNSVVFTGTRATLQKVKELVNQIDVPVRQVFIEALVLDASINQGLTFGVEWAGKIQRKNFSGQTGLIAEPSAVAIPLNNVGFPPVVQTVPPTVLNTIPLNEGFSVTGIGRKIRKDGTRLYATAGVVNLLRDNDDVDILVNPKIVTEHNVEAELFAGAQVPIKGQSIVNATADNATNTVATNFNTQNVGVTLKVTPLVSSGDMVTLIIEQIISTTNEEQVAAQGQDQAPPATIREMRVTTRVHMPSDYFLMMTGLIQNQKRSQVTKFPILGSLPIIGFLFSNTVINEQKRNLIMFLRPKIIDSIIDMEKISEKEEKKYKEATAPIVGVRGNLNDLKKILNF